MTHAGGVPMISRWWSVATPPVGRTTFSPSHPGRGAGIPAPLPGRDVEEVLSNRWLLYSPAPLPGRANLDSTDKNERKSAAEIGRALQVDELVEGSIARTADHVRVQLRLIVVKPEARQIWSQVYERRSCVTPSLFASPNAGLPDVGKSSIPSSLGARLPTVWPHHRS
jgi:hypothetical protein